MPWPSAVPAMIALAQAVLQVQAEQSSAGVLLPAAAGDATRLTPQQRKKRYRALHEEAETHAGAAHALPLLFRLRHETTIEEEISRRSSQLLQG
ncbi:MAG: hypothetical protein AB7N91_10235 [Candidatus Tectimicrobiota bacterium]